MLIAWLIVTIVVGVTALVMAAYLTNPFNKVHIIRKPYVLRFEDGGLQVADYSSRMRAKQGLLWRMFATAKCAIHILNTRYIRSPRSRSKTVESIIGDICTRRFRPERLLLISGDHFSGLFVRNLGIFYYPTLDTRIADKPQDWQDRQIVYAQSVAYALSVFRGNPIPATTIMEAGPYWATCVNYHAYPSDTVYGILYALAALAGSETAAPVSYAKPVHSLATQQFAAQLLDTYHDTLTRLYEHYRATVYDTRTGLISTDARISGAKDITKRQSAFFDNVIFWKTTQLAMQAGIIPGDATFLSGLKKRILKTFWLKEEGYFLEDLSAEGLRNKYYSSDWLIVYITGFLDPAKASERTYFERSVQYIREQKIDQPWPIKYQQDTRAHRQFFWVRLAVASYGGDAIWSFWGMEYIKVLLRLYQVTGKKTYLSQADTHIKSYKQAMKRDGGFPEVYDSQGGLLQTPLYRSIRMTGWVIGFEQVLAMRRSLI